jgi:glucosamine--fructose-6-phosphate aminotransferase (isomerizing)
MRHDHISFAEARAGQTAALRSAIARLGEEVTSQRAAGWYEGPGPVFVGIGASLAAAAAASWVLRSRGIHAWRLGTGDHPIPYPATDHPLVAVSQSGRSAETLAVLASVAPDLRYAVTNASPSPIATAATRHLSLGNLPDSYASTTGYTATVVGLGMLAEVWNGGLLDPSWTRLPAHVDEVEQRAGAHASALTAPFATARTADVVGAGPSVGSAEAGALLLREVARVPAAAMSTRQYLHGPMESAGGGVHVILGDQREADLARTLSGAGHPVVLVTSQAVTPAPCLQVVRLPALPPSQRAILEVVVMQVLAGRVAEQAGVDIEEFVFHHGDTKVGHDAAVGTAP